MKRIAVACNEKKEIEGLETCKAFELYDTEDGQVEKQWTIKNPGYTAKFIPLYLSDIGVKAVIADGMEQAAIETLTKRGMEAMHSVKGSAEDEVEAYLEGELKPAPVAC